MSKDAVVFAKALTEAGARHSSSDLQLLQTIHDHSMQLGASCGADESEKWKPDGALLIESAAFCEEIPRLAEAAATDYPVRLISPGRGSSGYYPPDVLRKAADSGLFKPGTQMFWNHDTDSEESQRPEGDLNRLAAVTSTAGKWEENGIEGPGVYARARVFSDYVDKVKEKGPHIGVSIRAGGDRDESAKGPDGKPRVIKELRNIQSVDFVTKPGRGGKIFTESSVTGNVTFKAPESSEGVEMTKEEIQALIREAQAPLETRLTEAQKENKQLRERLARSDAPRVIKEALSDIRLPDPIKNKIVRRLAERELPSDKKEILALVEAEAAEEANTLQEMGYYQGIPAVGARLTEAQVREQGEAAENQHKEAYAKCMDKLCEIFVGKPKRTGTQEDIALRAEAIEAFKEGRAA